MNDKSKLRKLNLKETQEELLNLLLKFDSFCKEHKINYFLSGGTLLGAIRHQGFIPWDDDIDLMLPRPDYQKLKYHLENSNISLEYQDFDKTEGYFFPYLRIVDSSVIVKIPFYERYDFKRVGESLNLFIDIFPLDGVPKSKFKQKVLIFKIIYLRKFAKASLIRIDWFTNKEDFLIKRVGKFLFTPFILLLKLFGHVYFLIKMDKILKKNEFNESENIAELAFAYDDNIIFSKNAVASSLDVNFEGYTFKAPLGYDEYLTNNYGSYMQLPPEDKRVTHFNGLVFKKE